MRQIAKETLAINCRHYILGEGYGHEVACAAVVTSAISLRKLAFEAMERLPYDIRPIPARSAGKPMRNPFSNASRAECLLSKLAGTVNDIAANAIIQICHEEHPGGLASVAQGAGRGMQGYENGAECTTKNAADTPSDRAAEIIPAACRRLYDENGA